MATWFTIMFEGEPTEADFARVSRLAAQGFTSGQLINEPGAEHEEGPATGYYVEWTPGGYRSTGFIEDDPRRSTREGE
jgi:hypothetical protein